MPISPAAPNFPLDVRTGAGIRAVREGATWRFDLNDEPILTTGEGAFFRVATEAGRTKLRNGLTVTIQADRDFLGVPYIEIDDNTPVRWVDVDGSPLARVVVGRVYRLSYDLAQDVMRSDVLSLVNNANLGPMAGATLKGNAGATPGGPQDIPLSLLAAPGNPIGDEIKDRVRFEEAPPLINERIARALLYRRKKHIELPYYNPVLVAALAAFGYPYLHPQAIAIDATAGEVWVLSAPPSGANNNPWFSVYNRSTGARIRTFTAPIKWSESMILRRVGGQRLLYTYNGQQLVVLDVTTLPADNVSLAPLSTTFVQGQNGQLTFDGDTFAVQSLHGTSGRRETWFLYDTSLARTGTIEFPMSVTGNISSIINLLPKAQGSAAYRGGYVFQCGGAYAPPGDTLTPARLHGLQTCSASGSVTATALSRADLFLSRLSAVAGRTLTITEAEGLSVANGKLYAAWMVLPVAERGQASALTSGILITEEMCADEGAVDFSDTACLPPAPFDRVDFETRTHVSSGPLTHPLTQAPLTFMSDIIDMMGSLGVSRYSYLGTNQTLIDADDAVVPSISGQLVRFEHKSTSCDVFITRGGSEDHYIVSTNAGAKTQSFYSQTDHGIHAPLNLLKGTGWLAFPGTTGLASGTAALDGFLYAAPVPLSPRHRRRTMTRIGFNITTVGAGGSARLMVYDDADGQPGVLLLDAGTVPLTTLGAAEATILKVFNTDLVWLVFATDDATVRLGTISASLPVLGFLSPSSANFVKGVRRAFAFAPAPADESAQTYGTSTVMPYVWMRG
ncbi:hypothetical protein [Methylorubrum extorquens]|uniref:Uncharacterized protein n=1 Tax=Methylorubrum extorquens TaxID=408 RepID=A0AAX3WDD3_METEX|nr:hypothetical protein [Methylorubrum extorquens]WHQ69481.1 hypothetical protein KEC54_24595 [Methylorubrum extorquens]